MTAAELLALLPPFEASTRRRAAEAVAARLAEGRDLLQVVFGALEARDRLRAVDLRDVAAAHAALTGAPARGRTARAIASGRLDRTVLAERVAGESGRREAEALVAFLVARRGSTSPAFERAAVRLAGDDCWRLARVGLESLPRPLTAAARELVGNQASSRQVWTRVAALEVLAGESGSLPLLHERLVPSDDPDDVFVRPAVARALARFQPREARTLLPALVADPSEHVRIELAAILAGLGDAESLRELARDPSPRVRAAAAIAVAPLRPADLIEVLARDPDDLPRRIALEEAEARVDEHPPLQAAVEALASGRIAAPPALARLAAEAAERLHHRLDGLGRRALAAARHASADLPEGASRVLEDEVPPQALGRALAVLATDDFGLEARAVRRGFSVRRGDRLATRLWRLVHEALHPAPEKRQGHRHTVARTPRGLLRAPPGRLAEVTATRVPGERVLVPALGDWGRHLPTVDDLLAAPPRGQPAFVFSSFGVTRIDFPAGAAARLRARTILTLRYAAHAELRLRSLSAAEPALQGRFTEAARRLGYQLTFLPHRGAAPAEILEVFHGSPAAAVRVPALAAALPPLGELMRGALDPATTGPSHLAALTAAALGLFVVAQNQARRRIARARAAIPLSLGGWGTRGKSGTERLKAALFQGLGCEVLAKTTGCEAMVIHALPGQRAQELFLYRPYDKATIWEQQQVLELAARLGVDVFLWECMALRPAYVDILAGHWMHDDACTITNAYPDHENIQGPAGVDIPRVMVDFIPRGRHVFTAEESMLPILRDGAQARGTALSAVRFRDHALLPEDLLARFPYQEHPHNIALVLDLASRLGVERAVALKEMADWVVPDLGVLKVYPDAEWRGRSLVFCNGMSANERTGFLNNWQRLGFDAPAGPREWVVTLVNNRADRVSRSEVFAGVLVNDAPAHLHVLIGTNLSGLRGYLETALAAHTRGLQLFPEEDQGLPPARRERLALERSARALERLRLGEVGALGLARSFGGDSALAFEALLARPPAGDLAAITAGFERALARLDPEIRPFVAREAARHALVLRWTSTVRAAGETPAGRARCERDFRALYAELFRASVVALPDPQLSGDQVIDAVARLCPPGFRVRLMGTQNIKGTGLDFAYRFIAHERTVRLVARLERAPTEEAAALARELAQDHDAGILDGPIAERAVRAALDRTGLPSLLTSAEAIAARQRRCEEALGRTPGHQVGPLRRAVGAVIDVYGGVIRRGRADRILDDLAAGRVSHLRAALELRELTHGQ